MFGNTVSYHSEEEGLVMLAGMSKAALRWDLQMLIPIPGDDPQAMQVQL